LPQTVVVVLVLVVGQNAVAPHADHLREGMLDKRLMARIIQGPGKLSGQPDPLVELPDRQQAGVAGHLGLDRLDDHRLAGKEIECLFPNRLYNHLQPPSCS
jgi:hypothetical protein